MYLNNNNKRQTLNCGNNHNNIMPFDKKSDLEILLPGDIILQSDEKFFGFTELKFLNHIQISNNNLQINKEIFTL